MRTHHRITTIALAAVLALAACGGGDSAEDGGTQGAVQGQGDGDMSEGGAREGRSVSGSESAQEQSTSVNDTTPHRPGSPSTP
jgi:ABC-type glycerol-3-phosphate transport system substrate-binding protein